VPPAPGSAGLAIVNKDGLFRAGLRRFPDDVFLVGRNVFRRGRRMTFDIVKHKRIRRDHRAQRVPLAAI
jgi:hypothetical protein